MAIKNLKTDEMNGFTIIHAKLKLIKRFNA